MLRHLRATTLLVSLLFSPLCAWAVPVVVDFEAFFDADHLDTQIAGLTLTNATVLSAGISLNEFEFPPRSGANVVLDDGGSLIIEFASPVSSVGGYFTYTTGLTIEAFDSLLNSVGIVSSAFLSNLALSGDLGSAPNEQIGLEYATGISRIAITGDPGGSSFTLDDLFYSLVAPSVSAPEPGTVPLLLTVLGILFLTEAVGGRRRQRA